MKRLFSYLLAVLLAIVSGEGSCESKGGFPKAEDVQRELEVAWQKIERASLDERFDDVTLAVEELSAIRSGLGLKNLSRYSERLFEIAKVRAYKGEKERAFLLSGLALSLSPESTQILLHSLAFDASVGFRTDWGKVLKVLGSAISDPLVFGILVRDLSYPILWAVSLGVFTATLLFFVYEFSLLVVGIGKFAPFLKGRRGRAEAVTLIVLLAPLCLGPLLTLVVWGIIAVRVLSVKAPLIGAGVVCILWGLVAPLKEAASINLGAPAVVYLLTGEPLLSTPDERANLTKLVADRPDLGAAIFSLAEVLKANGDLKKSRELFSESESMISEPGLAGLNEATLSYMEGDLQSSKKRFEEIHSAGLITAESQFNYSKVLFDLGKTTESSQALEKVRVIERGALERLQAIEESANEQSRNFVSDISLPKSDYFSLIFADSESLSAATSETLGKLAWGAKSSFILIIGIVSIIFANLARSAGAPLSLREKAHPTPGRVKALLKVVPGAHFVTTHKLSAAMVLLSLLWCAVCGVMTWPTSLTRVADVAPEIRLFSGLAILFLVIALGSFNFFAAAEERK